jgi:hypothetical protein
MTKSELSSEEAHTQASPGSEPVPDPTTGPSVAPGDLGDPSKNTTVVATIGVAEASYLMKGMIEFRPDLIYAIFIIMAMCWRRALGWL